MMIVDHVAISADDPVTRFCARCERPIRVCPCVPPAEQLILHFLSYVQIARVDYIARYLDRAWAVAPGTTRNTLTKLAQAGLVRRVGYGKYARVGVTPAELETKPAPLTTTLV